MHVPADGSASPAFVVSNIPVWTRTRKRALTLPPSVLRRLSFLPPGLRDDAEQEAKLAIIELKNPDSAVERIRAQNRGAHAHGITDVPRAGLSRVSLDHVDACADAAQEAQAADFRDTALTATDLKLRPVLAAIFHAPRAPVHVFVSEFGVSKGTVQSLRRVAGHVARRVLKESSTCVPVSRENGTTSSYLRFHTNAHSGTCYRYSRREREAWAAYDKTSRTDYSGPRYRWPDRVTR